MPLSLHEIVAAYEVGAEVHKNGRKLAATSKAVWDLAQEPSATQVGSVSLRDSARRRWAVDVRRDGRGRHLQFRPIGIDLERFRASADGHLPHEWLPIDGLEWTAFALFAAGEHDGGGHAEDEELTVQVARLLDRMVREGQHRGLVFDEDEE